MMKQDTKLIWKNILMFGFLLAVLQILISAVFSSFFPRRIDSFPIEGGFFLSSVINQSLFIGLLFLGLMRTAKQFSKPGYWWLVLIALGMLLVNYHFYFLYDLLDYYIIHQPATKPSGDDMEKLMAWVYEVNENPPPAYNPFNYLLGNFLINLYYAIFSFNLGWMFYFSITGIPIVPLWVSGLALFFSRKKKNNAE
jgi:hypothetical protein